MRRPLCRIRRREAWRAVLSHLVAGAGLQLQLLEERWQGWQCSQVCLQQSMT